MVFSKKRHFQKTRTNILALKAIKSPIDNFAQ